MYYSGSSNSADSNSAVSLQHGYLFGPKIFDFKVKLVKFLGIARFSALTLVQIQTARFRIARKKFWDKFPPYSRTPYTQTCTNWHILYLYLCIRVFIEELYSIQYTGTLLRIRKDLVIRKINMTIMTNDASVFFQIGLGFFLPTQSLDLYTSNFIATILRDYSCFYFFDASIIKIYLF